jgi:cell division septal protein FtsQ
LLAALRVAARLIAVLAVSAVVAGLGRHVLRWVQAHPYFALREIDVQGRRALDANTLLTWAGLTPGMSSWAVQPAAAERRLLDHPRLRAATVERILPDRVTIRVEERQAVAILLAAEPTLVALDGTAFPALEGESLDGLPYLSGVAAGHPATDAERLRAAARLVVRWSEHAEWPNVSEVRADGDDLVVFAAGTPMSVRFPAEARPEDFARLSAVLDLWRGREAQVAAIDLSLPGEAVLRLRGGKGKRIRASIGRTNI